MTETIAAPRYIAYVPLADLPPAARNPKRHELELIIDSIAMHGLVEVPVVDERTQRTLHGHGRRESLLEMRNRGMPLPGGMVLDNDGGWLCPVLRGWASKSEAEAEALAIKLNRLPGEGGWDPREFAAVLEDLATNEVELFDSLAIPADEMDALFARVDPETLPGGGREDETPLLHLPDDGERGDGLSPDDEGRAPHTTCPACGHLFTSSR
ncbi:ParB-like dsDNA partitioning protein [Streptomyces phage Gilgamesh]|uniref:ParB-like dsDNA partitioning protein n=1 Tax=Streptomyces phage Gilgamesh TaxID=2599890 RepID=A0A5J6TR39_9CAUD|nr:ParB-like dsDNA partitioning protein [Streptomyces phage Gilgamesh]QFG13276.1 ParB-like dsDNA partitioning protein [Streptomyces phage Gilgamesh]